MDVKSALKNNLTDENINHELSLAKVGTGYQTHSLTALYGLSHRTGQNLHTLFHKGMQIPLNSMDVNYMCPNIQE